MFDSPAKAIYYLLLFFSVVLATITYKGYKGTPNRFFLWFLWLTVLVECFGLFQYYYYKDCSIGIMPYIMNLIYKGYLPELYLIKNAWLYNSYRMVIYPLYIYYYYLLIKSSKKRVLLKYLLLLCIVISLIDIIINNNVFISEKLMMTPIVGGLFILISSTVFLMEVLKSDELLSFHKTLPFWVTFGALIFYLTTIPIFMFKEYLKEFNSYTTYTSILYFSNYFLYGCFITGFIVNAIEYNKREKLEVSEK